jgi:tRNA(Ile2) C34 agmatinyltransferase TiaS
MKPNYENTFSLDLINKARYDVGVAVIKEVIRKCNCCGRSFKSTGNRSCGCRSESRAALSGRDCL